MKKNHFLSNHDSSRGFLMYFICVICYSAKPQTTEAEHQERLRVISPNFCTFIPSQIKIGNQILNKWRKLWYHASVCRPQQCRRVFVFVFISYFCTLCIQTAPCVFCECPPFPLRVSLRSIEVELGNKRAQVALLFIHWRRSMANKQGEWKANPVVWSQLHPVQYNP